MTCGGYDGHSSNHDHDAFLHPVDEIPLQDVEHGPFSTPDAWLKRRVWAGDTA